MTTDATTWQVPFAVTLAVGGAELHACKPHSLLANWRFSRPGRALFNRALAVGAGLGFY